MADFQISIYCGNIYRNRRFLCFPLEWKSQTTLAIFADAFGPSLFPVFPDLIRWLAASPAEAEIQIFRKILDFDRVLNPKLRLTAWFQYSYRLSLSFQSKWGLGIEVKLQIISLKSLFKISFIYQVC